MLILERLMTALDELNPSTKNWLIEDKKIDDCLVRYNRSFEILSELSDTPVESPTADMLVVNSGGIKVNLICQQWNDEIWQKLPIQTHYMNSQLTYHEQLLKETFEWINTHFPDCRYAMKKLVCNLIFVNLRADQGDKDRQITSASFPNLPFSVFVSDKAFFHIPPNTLSQMPSVVFFAENLIHETIHQLVNLFLFDDSVFKNDFNAKAAPKIEIPWRTNSGERNRAWELDRAFHAYCVYLGILEFRQRVLKHNVFDVAHLVENALHQGIQSTLYLSEQLESYRDFFSASGKKLFCELQELESLLKIKSLKGQTA